MIKKIFYVFFPMKIQQQQFKRTVCHIICISFYHSPIYISLSLFLSACVSLFVSVYRFIARKTGLFSLPKRKLCANSISLWDSFIHFYFNSFILVLAFRRIFKQNNISKDMKVTH